LRKREHEDRKLPPTAGVSAVLSGLGRSNECAEDSARHNDSELNRWIGLAPTALPQS